MKKRLIQSLGLLLALILTACSNNDTDTMGTPQQTDTMAHLNKRRILPGLSLGNTLRSDLGQTLLNSLDLEKGIVFATYDRGDIHENIYVNSREAIEAVQNGEELPSGTVITLEGYRDGEIEHYLVMEKRTGWGSQYSPEERNGEWEYQHFTPDREVAEDNIGRCFSCHANQERDDYMNSMDQMKEFDLERSFTIKEQQFRNPNCSYPYRGLEGK